MSHHVRGYRGLKLRRARRSRPGYEFGGRETQQRVANYISANPPPLPPIEIHDVPSDPRGAGRCAFANRDIERGEVVVEYKGEHVSLVEAATREEKYAREGKICTLMVIASGGRQIAIDPYQGNEENGPTWGALINHSRNHANLRPFIAFKHSERPRVFLVALHDIPETVEFLWNYNDTDWKCHADSQTIPSQAL